jgi:hypothetical protein
MKTIIIVLSVDGGSPAGVWYHGEACVSDLVLAGLGIHVKEVLE